MIERPTDYPMTANSGIYDAGAFRIDNSPTVHRPDHFPDANQVVAKCGARGWATERESRIATWANAEIDCKGCNE